MEYLLSRLEHCDRRAHTIPSPSRPLHAAVRRSQDDFAGVKGLCISVGSSTFQTSKSHQTEEGIDTEPMLVSLAAKCLQHVQCLTFTRPPINRNKKVRRPEVAVILWYF